MSSSSMAPSNSQQSHKNNNASPSKLTPTSTNLYKSVTPKLYKAFLNDRTLSDLMIHLGDISVYAHRIVLCRGSEYFSRMLTGRFQESTSKEIELREDDPDSMLALLRFLYDLPYDAEANGKWTASLQPHVSVYVVADKYQLEPLKAAVAENMRKIIASKRYTHEVGYLRWCESFKNSDDFFSALQTILEITTTNDTYALKVLVDFLVQNFDFFRKRNELLSMFKNHPELAVQLFSHPDLESEAEGFWMCFSDDCSTNVPTCGNCKVPFEPYFMRRYRYDDQWECPSCKSIDQPTCLDCKAIITWVAEPERDVDEDESGIEDEDDMDVDGGSDAAAKASRRHAAR